MKKITKWKYRLRYLKTHEKNYSENIRLLHTPLGRLTFLLKFFFKNIFEIETRQDRYFVYIFKKKFTVLHNPHFHLLKYDWQYFMHLIRLRYAIKKRKIKVGFVVNVVEKWTCQSLYDAFKNSKFFEPIILITKLNCNLSRDKQLSYFYANCEYFKQHSMKYIKIYDDETDNYLPVKKEYADIIFYQQPWYIPDIQAVDVTYKTALLCYIPYCVYSMHSPFNYICWFHQYLWKFFVETDLHTKEYKRFFKARNCKALGCVKLDNYKTAMNSETEKHWKSKDKKRIIYAPHHSFERDTQHAVSTFMENGQFILDFAKLHPEIEWKFRPHPAFKDKLIELGLMSEDDVTNYIDEWAKIGTISMPDSNYYEEFLSSDGLITDCISFLTEYLPSGHPVFHLRTKCQRTPFNDIVNKIIDSYYQIYTEEDFKNAFEEVIQKGNDSLREKRIKCINMLQIDKNKTTGQKIVEFIEKQLWVRR